MTLRPIAIVLALASCGGQSGDMPDALPASELVITVRATPEASPVTWTLSCEPPGGDHPRPEAACQALETAQRDPFAPVPDGMMCTQVYGGPQTATITGTWRGAKVNASYRRTDGCEIARWDAIVDMLGMGSE